MPPDPQRGDAPIRILHVCESIKGGVSTSVNTLIGQQRADDTVEAAAAVCPTEHRQYLPNLADEHAYQYAFPKRSRKTLRNLAACLRQAAADFRPDVVHLHASMPGAIGRLPGLLGRNRPAIVYCARGWSFLMDVPASKRRGYALIERLLSRRCEEIICISKNEVEEAAAIGIAREKMQHIYNGFPADPPPAEPIDIPDAVQAARNAGRRVFFFLGRYDPQKGLDILLQSFQSGDAPGLLLCAGGSVLGDHAMPFGPHAIDVGWVTPGQITTLLEHSDAMIVPSRWEGFGNVAAEAMRCSRAVFCSRVGGLQEVVEDGVTGRILDDFHPPHFANAVADLSDDDLRRMGQAGRERYLRLFTDDRLHRETIAVYRKAIAKRS